MKTPKFFSIWTAVNVILTAICLALLSLGTAMHQFVINPVYLIMMLIGFLGFSMMGVLSIRKWKAKENKK